jgi:hypothetical protein
MNRVLLFFIFSIAQTGLNGQLVSFGSPWENPVGRNLLFSNDTAWYLASGTWPSAPHQSIQVHQFTLPAAGPPLLFQHITHTFPLYGEELLRFPDGRWLVLGTGFPLNSPPQGFHAILLPDGSLDTLQFTSFPNRLVQWKRGAILTNDLFYLTGTISQENGGGNDVYLALWHRTQGILWDRSLGTTDNETALAHFLLPDSSLIIVADKTVGGSVKQSFSRTQIDGFTQWDTDSDYPLSHGAQSLALMNDSILVCIGESTVPGIAGFDVLLSQLHIEGRLIRHVRLGGAGTDAGFWISQGNTGQWWLAGYSNSHDLNAPTAPFFSELSADWSQIKTQIWPSTELCFPRSLQVVPVQDSLHIFFAAAGQTQHFYLSETLQLIPSSLFQITDDVLPIQSQSEPLPFWLTPSEVKWPAQTYKGILSIYTLTGQKLVEWDVESGSTKGISLPFGVYMLHWQVNGANWPAKLWMYSD